MQIRATTVQLLLLAVMACEADPEIIATYSYEACAPVTLACPLGKECRGGQCLPPLAGSPDIGVPADTLEAPDTALETPDTTPAPDVPVGADPGVVTGEDTAGLPDTSTPDVSEAPDPGPTPPDVPEAPDVVEQPDPGVVAKPDECDFPGNPSTCPVGGPPFIYCRYEPSTANFVCDSSPSTFGYGTPCQVNDDCDVVYGCHFGFCTNYCEKGNLGAGCASAKCGHIGHPKWGACEQL